MFGIEIENDRESEIIEGEGWQLQIEDCLPMLLNDVKKVFIPKGVYHRLIKGYNTLRVKINENHLKHLNNHYKSQRILI